MKKATAFLRKSSEIIFFIFAFILWTAFMCYVNAQEGGDFKWHDLKVEANGMIFDLFVFGILVTIYNAIRARKEKIERLKEEIDDYRGWDEKEAMYRIVGTVKRLIREGYHEINLENCYLSDAYLPDIDLHSAILSKANLKGSNLTGANLSGANLSKTNLKGANLTGANLSGANLSNADLTGANLSKTDLTNADLSRAIMSEFVNDYYDTNEAYEMFIESSYDLEGEIIEQDPFLHDANRFFAADLSNAILCGAKLNGAYLNYVDLKGADLSGAKLKSAELTGARLVNANLSGTNLSAANLVGAYLENAIVKDNWLERIVTHKVLGHKEILEKYILQEKDGVTHIQKN